MNISLTFYATGISTNNLRVVVYEASAPTVEVSSQLFNPPHATPRTISFTGLEDVAHLVKIYETPTSSGGTLRHDFLVQATGGAFRVKAPEYLTVDTTTDLDNGTTEYINTDWDGWDIEIERVGMGTMKPGVDYNALSGGGFELLQTGDTFQPNEKFVVRFLPQVTTVNTGTNTIGKLFSDTEVITTNTSLDNTYQGKAVRFEGASAELVCTLPDISTAAENRMFFFLSEGGSHINAVLNCFGSDVIRWRGQALTQVILGKSEEIHLYKHDDEWRVAFSDGNFKSVGETFFAATDEADILNAIELNGRQLDKAEYPRLWDYVSNLPATQVKTYAVWNTTAGKGYFCDYDADNFYIPDMRDKYLRASAASTTPGEYMANTIIDHKHEGVAGTLPSTLFGRGWMSRVIGFFNGQGTGLADLTSSPVKTDGSGLLVEVSSETRPETRVQKLFIRI